jgi:hypothetical protein
MGAGGASIWLPLLIGGGTGVASSLISSSAAGSAAQTQVGGALQAASLVANTAANSLAFQKQQWAQTQANEQPYLAYGRGAVAQLGQWLGITPDYPPQVPDTSTTQQQTLSPNEPGFGPTGQSITPGIVTPTVNPVVAANSDPTNPTQPSAPGAGSPHKDVGTTMGQIYGPSAPPSGAPANQGATSRVTWNDGSTSAVPSQYLDQYLLLGAKQA